MLPSRVDSSSSLRVGPARLSLPFLSALTRPRLQRKQDGTHRCGPNQKALPDRLNSTLLSSPSPSLPSDPRRNDCKRAQPPCFDCFGFLLASTGKKRVRQLFEGRNASRKEEERLKEDGRTHLALLLDPNLLLPFSSLLLVHVGEELIESSADRKIGSGPRTKREQESERESELLSRSLEPTSQKSSSS